jgi:D-alanyl-D-alanine dipeptidase
MGSLRVLKKFYRFQGSFLLLAIMFLIFFLGVISMAFQAPCKWHQNLEAQGLVDVQKLNPNILVRLAYSEKENFMKMDVYACLSKAFLQKPAALKLSLAQSYLEAEMPGYHLLVWDASRPAWAQKILWESIKKPESVKHVYVAHPKRGSIHNYGCAVDLTLANHMGKELDMGTPYDYFGELAQPRLEEKMRKAGRLTEGQLKNRQLLRRLMKKAGFLSISSEWWHFNFCSLAKAKSIYKKVE